MTQQTFEILPDGIRIFIRATPKAAQNKIMGFKIFVTAVPEDGKANKAIVRLLAKTWGIAKSSIEMTAGEHHRDKTFIIRCDAEKQAEIIDYFKKASSQVQ